MAILSLLLHLIWWVAKLCFLFLPSLHPALRLGRWYRVANHCVLPGGSWHLRFGPALALNFMSLCSGRCVLWESRRLMMFSCLKALVCCRGGKQCCFPSAPGNPSRGSSRLRLWKKRGDAVTKFAVSPLSAGAWWSSWSVWLAHPSSQPLHLQGVSGNHPKHPVFLQPGPALAGLGFLKPRVSNTVSINQGGMAPGAQIMA